MKNLSPSQAQMPRRQFMQLGLGLMSSLVMPASFAAALKQPERRIAFDNLHTGEKLKTTYWSDGQYQPEALKEINIVLRDHYSDDVCEMAPQLIDLLNLLQHSMDSQKPFQIISAYRSPKTNAALRNNSSGVAKKSQHMLGEAVDIRLPGVELAELRQAAIAMQAGGVGYYPKSRFIHLDIGRVRQWG
jgi:uncharacterized protein YcbK (DUF882 family)